MTPDLSRDSFDPEKNFTRVIMQQGRVQLDADWNEQADIILRMIREMFVAIVGTSAGPPDLETVPKQVGTTTKPEIPAIPAFRPFKIGYVGSRNDEKKIDDLTIGAGYYYVNGIRCENPSDTSYLDQPYLEIPTDPDPFLLKYPYLVYLDVWEEPVTVLDDDSLREPALGGLDTSVRSRVRLGRTAEGAPRRRGSGWKATDGLDRRCRGGLQ